MLLNLSQPYSGVGQGSCREGWGGWESPSNFVPGCSHFPHTMLMHCCLVGCLVGSVYLYYLNLSTLRFQLVGLGPAFVLAGRRHFRSPHSVLCGFGICLRRVPSVFPEKTVTQARLRA